MKTFPAASLLVLSCLASCALAVKTQYFTATTREDFAKGTSKGVVITNHGQVKLARQTESLLPADQQFDAISAITHDKAGAIVFGTFPEGEIIRLKDGKQQRLANFKDRTITALAVNQQGRVLVALAGGQAEVLALDEKNQKHATVFKEEGVDYVWSIVPEGERLLLGTGPEARIYQVAPDGKAAEVAKLAGQNVLSLLAGPDGTIYAGTDQYGLVYRIDPKTNKPFILYDAPESEISALGLDAQGNLLAATSEMRERQEIPVPDKAAAGKPANAASPATIQSQPPASPTPPQDVPGEPIPHDAPAEPEEVDTEPTTEPTPPGESAGPMPPHGHGGASDGPPGGNAVYRIDPNGFVTEVFRANTFIYSMAVTPQAILLGTGDSGEIYELRPDSEEAVLLTRAEATQVTAVLPAPDGTIVAATANNGSILRLSGGYAAEGVFESQVLDAALPSRFGTLQVRGRLPEKTSITVQTRSGNIANPDEGGWSEWSAPQPVKAFLSIPTPVGRYVQYRLTLGTTDPSHTPAVDDVTLAYQRPNVAPRIASVSVNPAGDPQNPGAMLVTWEASDANEDELRYAVYARQLGRSWVTLAEDLTETNFTWSARQTADGLYEVKVVASDARSNPVGEGKEAARVSDTVLVDNTPPVIGDVKIDGTTVTLRVVDRASTITSLEYAVDHAARWQKALPNDTIADSPEERYTLALTGLAKGQHTLTVRATDSQGNTGYETLSVSVP